MNSFPVVSGIEPNRLALAANLAKFASDVPKIVLQTVFNHIVENYKAVENQQTFEKRWTLRIKEFQSDLDCHYLKLICERILAPLSDEEVKSTAEELQQIGYPVSLRSQLSELHKKEQKGILNVLCDFACNMAGTCESGLAE